MEAKKKKRSPYSRRRRFILTGIVFALVLVFLHKPLKRLFHVYGTPPGVTEFKTSLDPEFVPTAEYLIENPEPLVDLGMVNLVNYSFESYADSQNICLNMWVPIDPGGQVYSSTEIYVNNRLMAMTYKIGCDVLGPPYDCVVRCSGFQPAYLESGVHLIEVRMKYHPDDEPFHIQKWGFRIEE